MNTKTKHAMTSWTRINGSKPNSDAQLKKLATVQEVRQLLATDGTLTTRAVMERCGITVYRTAWAYLRDAKLPEVTA